MEWSKKQTLDLIELVHAQECLWNVKNELYKDRKKKKDAMEAIALQMQISLNDIDKKIINLKNQFNREVNKMKTRSGSGTDDVYVSSWYAFKPLSFLKNNNLPKPARSTDSISEEYNDDEETTQSIEDVPSVSEVSGASDVSVSTSERKSLKRAKPSEDRQKEALYISILKEARDNIMKRPPKDEFDVFGEYVASELRGIKGKINILELKKQIHDLIYITKLKEIERPLASLERQSEPRVWTENQEMEVASNIELNSESEEIDDSYELQTSLQPSSCIRMTPGTSILDEHPI